MKTVKIIPMSAEHLDALASLERICFSRPWSRQMLADELDNQCAAFLVALEPETEKVIGYAGLLVAADEGYITNVAVDPSRRRQGVAAQLIHAGLKGDTGTGGGLLEDHAKALAFQMTMGNVVLFLILELIRQIEQTDDLFRRAVQQLE
mgnify:CR=1 FL=1